MYIHVLNLDLNIDRGGQQFPHIWDTILQYVISGHMTQAIPLMKTKRVWLKALCKLTFINIYIV